MNSRRTFAATQLLLMFPAILFMGALVVRQLSTLQQEPARTAQQIVMWYAARLWTLWVLLIMLPLAVFLTGGIALLRTGGNRLEMPKVRSALASIRADGTMRIVAVITFIAGVILAIVALHMAAN